MQVDSQIDKVESSKCKLVEFKKEILQQADDAELILSKARSKVDNSEALSADDQNEIKDALTLKRKNAESTFKRLESAKDAEKNKLTESLEE